jgi:CBS-domain-containing membrane protein
MVRKLKRFLGVLGIFWAIALAMLLTMLWFAAHVSGDAVTVTINDYGEQTAELVLWFVVWPVIAVGLFYGLEIELV